ncbi:MAG TPA: hypothetical protein VNU68_31980 [Verrucomicrobiae bacterium]|nr:hypothetical protein [Verrucomicrobiae bacterium]
MRWIGALALFLAMGAMGAAWAFSLYGPLKNGANGTIGWQAAGFGGRPQGLGYAINGETSGPMTPLEGYRWNVPVVTYAFDSTFLRYFGTNGVKAVDDTFAMLNALPPASAMSLTLAEFPLDSKGVNQTATTLGLLDVKSRTLRVMMAEMGLANPERYAWSLRDRRTGQGFTNYSVIQLSYDPVTIQESRYVNGVLYNYRIFDDLGPQGAEWASAVEWYQLDPLFVPYSSVAGGIGSRDLQLGSSPDNTSFVAAGLSSGEFYRGLTRDDAGGIRFLLSTNNIVVESLLPDVFPSSVFAVGGSPWTPFPGGTNVGGTNVPPPPPTNTVVIPTNFVQVALRPGRDKITFQRVNFDSLLGTTFTPITNRYVDKYVHPTSGRLISQRVQRVIQQPDILFVVGDLGTDPVTALPVIGGFTDASGWSNNVALNSQNPAVVNLGGPGLIIPGIIISFSDLVPYFANDVPGQQDTDAFPGFIWGSFDGSDQPPAIYPVFTHPLLPNLSLQFLQSIALGRNKN